jgi:hypothetical protein
VIFRTFTSWAWPVLAPTPPTMALEPEAIADKVWPDGTNSRNRTALLKITVEGPELFSAQSYSEDAKPDRLAIGFDD